MSPQVDGYVTDVAYVRTFIRMLAPAWLDHVALVNGFRPPARSEGFTWCDLGCGPGVTAVLLAGLHPQGRFFGIDAMPQHTGYGTALAAEAGVRNVRFHAADFAAAAALDLPAFDYIVAHGVYSWVGAQSQLELLRFIDRFLKPGGLVYLSYNAMPGWSADLSLQRLIYQLAERMPGDSLKRVAAAAETVGALAGAKAPALLSSALLPMVQAGQDDRPVAYLAHEFLGASWKPLYVTEVRAAMAGIGLAPVGAARLIENYDNFVLGKEARAALAAIGDEDLRELARDFFINQHLRCDVYSRDAATLGETERTRRLCAARYILARPAARIDFSAPTPAGSLGYDNPVARGIVAELAKGPRQLTEIGIKGASRRDLLANLLTLCAADQVWPVEGARAPVTRLVKTIYGRLDGPAELLHLPLPCGTAIAADRGLLRCLRDGGDLHNYPGWKDFLAAQAR